MSTNNKLLIVGVVVAVVVVVVGIVLFSGKGSVSLPGPGYGAPGAGGAKPGAIGPGAGAPPVSTTKAPAPTNAVAPEAGATAPVNVAVPKTETVAAPGVSAKLRTFKIDINVNKFAPDTVIINKGDTAQITFTAVDKNYDVVQPDLGFRLEISKGSSRLLAFDGTNTGKFTIYCDSCGGPKSGPLGYIIVVDK